MKAMYPKIVVIPSYEPDEKLITLLKELSDTKDYRLIVVDDGSGRDYQPIFTRAADYATILTHNENQGKGAALKTAFSYIKENIGTGCMVVTADSDGQHSVTDIGRALDALNSHPRHLVLGSRKFTGKVPLKSRMGNSITRVVFALTSHGHVQDTQTGLRAFMGDALDFMLQVSGNRYEYEMNMLIFWVKEKRPITEVPIETIYIDNNTGSHFRPLQDSYMIYAEIIKYSCSSLICFVIDYLLYILFLWMTKGAGSISVSISNIFARILSATVNFHLNRNFVFQSDADYLKSAFQYFLLAVCVLFVNTNLLTLLTSTILPNRYVAKILVEITMFLCTALVQKLIIFRHSSVVKKSI